MPHFVVRLQPLRHERPDNRHWSASLTVKLDAYRSGQAKVDISVSRPQRAFGGVVRE
jgi:hypothetical protein